MQRTIFFISCLAFVGASAILSDASIDFNDPRAIYYDSVVSKSGIASRIKCVTDKIDKVVIEYRCEAVWRNIEQQLLDIIGNMLLCLNYQGFRVQA